MEKAKKLQNGDYRVIGFPTYGVGLAEMRRWGEQPKTFKENIEARVIAYENGDRELFDTRPINSCTAVVNKELSTEFKIVPKSKDLITISEHFNDAYLPVTYADVKNGIELDFSKGKYNQLLPEGEPLENPGWIESVDNRSLLKAYHDIIFKGFKKERAMGFYVRQNTDENELRILFVLNLDNDSDAYGDYLNINCSFLLGSPVRAAGAASEKIESSPSPEQCIVRLPTRDEILTFARPYVAEPLWSEFTKIVPDKAPVLGDVLQRTIDGNYLSPHSLEEFKMKLEKLY